MPWRREGFTLVELLMAVAIGALLMAIAVPSYETYVTRVRADQAVADLGALDIRIERHMANHFRLPDSLADLRGELPVDPWGRPYVYLRIQGAGPMVMRLARKDRNLVPINSDFDLYSLGPDGASRPPLITREAQDDIIRAGNGAFLGTAADF